MFTGIITETGTIIRASRTTVTIRTDRDIVQALEKGVSVSVDGICLTVVEKGHDIFTVDIMPETAHRTTAGGFKRNAKINLELPATPNSFLSGHIVHGHVDGIGMVVGFKKSGTDRILTVSVPRILSRYLVPQGSVTVSGVSLTVIDATTSIFTVGIIPHTLQVTTLGSVKPGDSVNIEVDVLAKYAEKQSVTPPRASAMKKKIHDIRIGIIGSSFRSEITAELEKHCLKTLRKKGIAKEHIRMVRVPGAFEIPLVAKMMAAQGTYDALIVFGAILKGKTYHFEQIANECAHGCAEVARTYGIPVVFEVLAVYDLADAMERATRTRENKGVEAAETALAMITVLSSL